MSHIVTIKTQLKDLQAIRAACGRLGLAAPREGTAKLYEASATGVIVHLEGWLYPLVISPTTGAVQLDNYNGAWGKPAAMDAFKQAYTVEKARIEARKRGHTVNEVTQPDGSIRLTITGAKL